MKRSKFSLSHYKLATCNQGELVPIGLLEVLPGDSIQHSVNCLIRVSPLNAPIMHPVHVRIHSWFIPIRTIWDDFEDFITGGPDGVAATAIYPTKTFATGPAIGSLADYLGMPTGINGLEVSALPFRAYAKTYNENYRDQDLTSEVGIETDSGGDTTTNTSLLNVAWEKDYFTSARPTAQKGPSVTLPLGSSAPVTGLGLFDVGTVPTAKTVRESGFNNPAYTLASQIDPAAAAGADAKAELWAKHDAAHAGYPDIKADLTNATAATINELREAMAVQRYEEARARYGSRYTEYLRYLGIKSSDARIQRPEYLGGGRQTIQFSEVLRTGSGNAEDNPKGTGQMLGHGIGAMRSNRYRRFFEEHGYVLTLLSVLPRTMYFQGLPRHWNRRTKEDFFQKELQHIGQQEVLNKEIYAAHASPNAIFGFQDRYDEYRRMESSVAGDFKSTLNVWHMARDLASTPALNSAFVVANPTNRIYQSTSEDQLYVYVNHSIQARRMVAGEGTSHIF